jgi:hypothetical protein
MMNVIKEVASNKKCFYVIHPLDDKKEEKCCPDNLGRMPLSKSVKYSLLSLRLYLVLMGGLVLYRALQEMAII